MSVKYETTCDKCGREIKNETGCYNSGYALHRYSAKIMLWGVGAARYKGGQRIDLCNTCYEKFVDFLERDDEE